MSQTDRKDMGRPLRVVIADDEADLRLLLRMQLRRNEDLTVVGEAKDGAEAIAVATNNAADVVVMDLLMPGTSGFEAIATLQQTAPHIRAVAYTAVAGDFVRMEMQRLGVELVLKSGDVDPLVRALLRTRATPQPADE